VLVKLVDDDFGKFKEFCLSTNFISLTKFCCFHSSAQRSRKFFSGPDPDDDMDAVYTDKDGHFEIGGSTYEYTTIDPYLKIYHDCNDGVTVSNLNIC
jgi:hypothetical protein